MRAVERQAALFANPSFLWRSDGNLAAPAASMVLHSPHPVGVVLNSPPSACPEDSTSSGFIGSTGKDPTVRRKATGAIRFQKR